MSIYTAITTRQYAEGRICITTDRISGYLSNEGGSSSLWRKLLEWTGQKRSFETITIGVVNNSGINYRKSLEQLIPISFEDISLNDVTYNSLDGFDLLYFIGLPSESSNDLETVIESYIKDGGGLYIEVPDKSGIIEILRGIESINCASINRPLFEDAYWTPTGQSHYAFSGPVNIGFLTTLDVSTFSSSWTPLMTSTVSSPIPVSGPTVAETTDKIGSEFGIGYTIAMQKGIVEIDVDMSSSSSSSFDSSSSSTSSSTEEDTSWDFCDNIVAYWKMDENTNNPIVWDEKRDFKHMGILKSGSTPIYTSGSHVPGVVNGALSFNGVTDKIVTSSNTTLNFPGVLNDLPFSISFWIFPKGQTGYVLCKSCVWGIYLANSILYMILYSTGGGYRLFYMSNPLIPLNKWTNITFAYDGSLAGMSIYYNGSLQTTTTDLVLPYTTMSNVNSSLYISANISSDFFHGYVDNVYILDKKINEIEAEVLWNEGRGTDQCKGIYRYTSSSTSSSSSIDSSSSSSSEGYSSSTSSSSFGYSTSSSSSSSSSFGYSTSSSSSSTSSSSSSSFGYSSSSSSSSTSNSSSSSNMCCINPAYCSVISGYYHCDTSTYYSDWTFFNLNSSNSNACLLYVEVRITGTYPNYGQSFKFYKTDFSVDLVAEATVPPGIGEGSITIEERNFSGLTGSVYFHGGVTYAYANILMSCNPFPL